MEMDEHLKSAVLEGWPDQRGETLIAIREHSASRDEISVQNGVLFKGDSHRSYHIHWSRMGAEVCYRQALHSSDPTCKKKLKTLWDKCATCNECSHDQQKETMMLHSLPKWPWQILSMDLFNYAGKDFLLIADHYSDFCEKNTMLAYLLK